MSDTVLNLLQRVSRKLGLTANLIAISEADESQWLLDRLNERYQDLRRQLPLEDAFFQENTTLTIDNSQRLYALLGSRFPEVYFWSFNNTETQQMLSYITLEDLSRLDVSYKTTQGEPRYVYVEAGLLGFYPLASEARTIEFLQKTLPEKLQSDTDTIALPSTWLPYLELAIELDYQLWKGLGLPEVTLSRLSQQYVLIYAELNRLSQTHFKSE